VENRSDAAPNALRRLRGDAGYTQQELADQLGVDSNTISRWERGAVTPHPQQRRSLAEAFGVTITELQLRAEPAATVDPLAFLEEPTITTVDARITRSQQDWITTRRALNANRHALTQLAAQSYPEACRLGDTGVIAGPGWIPDAPVPLDAITLTLDHEAPAPELDGSEPQSGHVRPHCSVTRQFGRYTQAVRDLDHPRLFENRAAWRITDLDWSDGKGRMTFGDTWYFAAVDVNEVVAHEMALAALDAGGHPAATPPAARDLPYRRMLGSPFALHRRPVMPAVSTLTIRGGSEPTFLLHRRDSKSVAMAGGMLQVIPSGIFQPSSVHPAAVEADFSIWRNLQREYAEELLGYDEHDGDGQPISYAAEPFAAMDAAREAGQVRVHALGVALDALTLVGEILTVAVIDPDVFDVWARDFVTVNDEGTIVNQRLRFDEDTVSQVLASGRMAPAGAACLQLAWQHHELLM
jgi:transcriptional regulator with XRE-family HTH domain